MEDKRIKKRDISKQKIINKRRKTDDSTNSDVLIMLVIQIETWLL